MQVIILCGGKATRLGALAKDTPKSLVDVSGRPFLAIQIELLKKMGATEIVLCTGYLGDQIEDACGDGRFWEVSIQYSHDGIPLQGTAGAIKKASPLLRDQFFVLYGDSYLPIELREIFRRFTESGKLGMMVVYKNDNKFDTSNVILDNQMVKTYDKKFPRSGMAHIDAGISILQKEALEFIPSNDVSQLETFYRKLVDMGELAAFETNQRFYEVGSLTGLEEFRRVANKMWSQEC